MFLFASRLEIRDSLVSALKNVHIHALFRLEATVAMRLAHLYLPEKVPSTYSFFLWRDHRASRDQCMTH